MTSYIFFIFNSYSARSFLFFRKFFLFFILHQYNQPPRLTIPQCCIFLSFVTIFVHFNFCIMMLIPIFTSMAYIHTVNVSEKQRNWKVSCHWQTSGRSSFESRFERAHGNKSSKVGFLSDGRATSIAVATKERVLQYEKTLKKKKEINNKRNKKQKLASFHQRVDVYQKTHFLSGQE